MVSETTGGLIKMLQLSPIDRFISLFEKSSSNTITFENEMIDFKQQLIDLLWKDCQERPDDDIWDTSVQSLKTFWILLLARKIWDDSDAIRQIWSKSKITSKESLYLRLACDNLAKQIKEYSNFCQAPLLDQLEDSTHTVFNEIPTQFEQVLHIKDSSKDEFTSGIDCLKTFKNKLLSDMCTILTKSSVDSNEIALKVLQKLHSYTLTCGYGIFSEHTSARWKSFLLPIKQPSSKSLQHFIGYENVRGKLIKNTETFLEGKPAHNVLLYGDRGTGKSSSIHAMLNEYWMKRLRLVEVSRGDYNSIPDLFAELATLPYHFIILLDDLSFETDESEYKTLKTALEGGAQTLPVNVLLYATSNRRHFIKEAFSDKNDIKSDEVRHYDTIQEKMSLADRFGLVLSFFSPTQNEYLEIVKGLAALEHMEVDEAFIARALRFEREHAGRSPRIANQFIRSEHQLKA